MKTQVFLDTECFKDYWLAMFMLPDGRTKSFELYEGHPLNIQAFREFLSRDYEFITFNGNSYDLPMIAYALEGVSTEGLKKFSDTLINDDIKPWEVYDEFGLVKPTFDHIDIIELCPLKHSLKLYAARLHCAELQDLPFAPSELIATNERRLTVRLYCRKDLLNTQLITQDITAQIDLRRVMSEQLGEDVRSKSDAQIAEVVLKHAYVEATGRKAYRKTLGYGKFNYTAPPHVGFRHPTLQRLLDVLTQTDFTISDTGHVDFPAELDDLDIRIGSSRYKVGIGGLHSQESEVSYYADDEHLLRDIDVESYYPSMMVNMGMYPDALGPVFLESYEAIRQERVAAKRSGDKVKSDVLKITLNGTFGKTSSRYSILYNPSMMAHTTLTGQLNLLMLIEALEAYNIPVVSANTDGIVVRCPRDLEGKLKKIVTHWEGVTNLRTEETNYRSIHMRDVNNYIAIKLDGKVKTKGTFASAGLWKNPQNQICSTAVINYLTLNIPIEKTITECRNISQFLTVRTVNGGAVKPGYELGKVIRWYYGNGETGTINYATNGNTVARSEGAVPLMNLPDKFPDDVNFGWYIQEAHDMLMDIGVVKRPPPVKLPRKNSKAWKEMVEKGLISV